MELWADPTRAHLAGHTGIYVRARRVTAEGWHNVDIAELSAESLTVFLRSRGGDNPWAESVVRMLLGHES